LDKKTVLYVCDFCGWTGAKPAVFSDPFGDQGMCWSHYICPECELNELRATEIPTKEED
jgi:hypothetical protein